jgi:hypothetical protein
LRFSSTGSPAPAQSPEFSDVQTIFGRIPSKREFNMVRGMIDRDKERVHKLAELLCDRCEVPLNQELIELRALQVRTQTLKNRSGLILGECVAFAFLESAKQSGNFGIAMKALAETQLLDANLKFGLSRIRLPAFKFVVEVPPDFDTIPVLLVDGVPRNCKVVEIDNRLHGRTHLFYWRPLLADCLGRDFGRSVKRVYAAIRRNANFVPLRIARKESPGDMKDHVDVVIDPRRFFYDFTTKKEMEVDLGFPRSPRVDSDFDLALKKIGRQLDSLSATVFLYRMTSRAPPSHAIWFRARNFLADNSQIAVTPRRKAAAAIIAADMQYYDNLDSTIKTRLAFAVRKVPLAASDDRYACAKGLIVPSEFSRVVGMPWTDAFSLGVKFCGGARYHE